VGRGRTRGRFRPSQSRTGRERGERRRGAAAEGERKIDDPQAKNVARELATVLGFEAIDAGGLSAARELEHLAMLWISLA
jgi:hypothetical protein